MDTSRDGEMQARPSLAVLILHRVCTLGLELSAMAIPLHHLLPFGLIVFGNLASPITEHNKILGPG